jgi:hypothetical protein
METKQPEKQITKTRLIIGTIVFIVGLLMPLLVPVVAGSNLNTGMKAALSGLLLLGIPEVFMFITVAILGKEGFNFLKSRLFGWFKKSIAPSDFVSKTRYRIGLVMFVTPLLMGFILPYFDHLIPNFMNFNLYINLIGDVSLISSFFVLGGDFWDKLRALFIHRSSLEEQ